jgi:hypothetical protein
MIYNMSMIISKAKYARASQNSLTTRGPHSKDMASPWSACAYDSSMCLRLSFATGVASSPNPNRTAPVNKSTMLMCVLLLMYEVGC